METASQILRRNGVEIDASDHRTPEEIVKFLGLSAVTNDNELPQFIQELAAKKQNANHSPYLAH